MLRCVDAKKGGWARHVKSNKHVITRVEGGLKGTTGVIYMIRIEEIYGQTL